jgi:hypothetical protein
VLRSQGRFVCGACGLQLLEEQQNAAGTCPARLQQLVACHHGLHPVRVCRYRGVGALTGLAATWLAPSLIRSRIGLEMTGLLGLGYQVGGWVGRAVRARDWV